MATTTLTTTGAQDARIIAAFGRRLHLESAPGVPRSATAAEVKAAIGAYLTQVVLEEESAAAREAAVAGLQSPVVPT